MIEFGIPSKLRKYIVTPPGYPKSSTQNGMAVFRQRGLLVIWSNGLGWEHVSVSRQDQTPSYEDMCWAKENWWWNPETVVMQLHVGKSNHINCHPYCLHLWRPTDDVIPTPPLILVGPKG